MASESSLARLHRTEQNEQIARLQQPVKNAKSAHLKTDVSAPAPAPVERLIGFRIDRAEAEIDYRVGGTPLMSSMSAEAPPLRSSRFAALAQREQTAQLIERYGRRMRKF